MKLHNGTRSAGAGARDKPFLIGLLSIRRMSFLSGVFLLVFVFQSDHLYEWQRIDLDLIDDAPRGLITNDLSNSTTIQRVEVPMTKEPVVAVAPGSEVPSPILTPRDDAFVSVGPGKQSSAGAVEEMTLTQVKTSTAISSATSTTTTAAISKAESTPSSNTSTNPSRDVPKDETTIDHAILQTNQPAITDKPTTNKIGTRFRLIQVINTFAINKDDQNDFIHQPYDQWSTLHSIEEAKQHAPSDLDVTLVCAMFQSDMEVLSKHKVPACDRSFLLERSTITEYHNENTKPGTKEALLSERFSKRELPFLQDLFDAGISVARDNTTEHRNTDDNDDFYVMVTNSDIGLTKNFYNFLLSKLQTGQKAFTINRWTIPMEGKNHPITVREPTTEPQQIKLLLSQIDASLPTGETHPGYDCFIIHSSIIDKIFLGKMFAGFPPWGGALSIILKKIVARDSYTGVSSSPNATFHLGGQGAWSKKKDNDKVVLDYIKEIFREDIQACPKTISPHEPYTLMNAANCGRVFREFYNATVKKPQGKDTRKREKKKRRQKMDNN